MAFDPQTRLLAGSRILAPLLNYAGFGFEPGEVSDEGHSAEGRFVAGDRAIELRYQWGLAEVRFRVGDWVLEHAEYMRLLGVEESSSLLAERHQIESEGFEALLEDLTRFAAEFLAGDAQRFCALAAQAQCRAVA
ncbi:MAG: hypothetical protein KF847_12870 [Pirellulales bacterium]|nr:hypothetical protein [Pirellulales bacterium]